MTPDDIDVAWSAVQPPASPDAISGRRAAGLPRHKPAYLAVDGAKHRHLLVQIPDGTLPVTQRETRSLEVTTARLQVGSNPEALYVDLECLDSTQHGTFSAVVHDILRSLNSSQVSVRDAVVDALARWRSFWGMKSSGMSCEDALGLFGELWFMRRWLAPVTADVVQSWQATDRARHDFQRQAASIEVKTAATRSAGEPAHDVGSLDQLADPEHGQLFLFSLQVCDDALASNTLSSLVQGIAADLQSDFASLTLFNEKLTAWGYSPDDRQAGSRPLRIVAERLYRIADGFPRITRKTFGPAGVPVGILDIGYSISLAACHDWLIATTPTAPAASILK